MSRTFPITTPRNAALLALLLATCAVQAEEGADAKAGPGTSAGDAKVVETVIEDDSTRIEELRVRGHTQKVTVQPKNSKLPSYEIIMGDGSRDLSPGAGTTRAAAGRRVWSVLNF